MAGRSVRLFLFIKKYYCTVGIYSPQPNQIRCSFNRKNGIFLVCSVQSIVSSTAFLLFEANSVLDLGMPIFFLACLFLALTLYSIAIWEMGNICEFIENCEAFIETRHHTTNTYKELSEKIETLCKWFCLFALITVSFCAFSILIFSMVNYYIFDLGEESFYLIFPAISFPFDWRTPFGYFLTLLAEVVGGSAVFLAVILTLSLIFASSWLFITIANDDLRQDLAGFNNIVNSPNGHTELMRNFCDIIQLYVDAKVLVNQFNKIHRFLIFSFFLWGIVCVCSTLLTLQFQLADNNSKLIEVIISSLIVFWVFLALLLNCEPGEQVSQAFERFDDEFKQCNWHLLSTDLMQLYLIFLLDTEQPINFQCFGRILCTRETFKKITNTGFSYFATIRQLK